MARRVRFSFCLLAFLVAGEAWGARIEFRSNDERLYIKVDGQVFGTTPIMIDVAPGIHRVEGTTAPYMEGITTKIRVVGEGEGLIIFRWANETVDVTWPGRERLRREREERERQEAEQRRLEEEQRRLEEEEAARQAEIDRVAAIRIPLSFPSLDASFRVELQDANGRRVTATPGQPLMLPLGTNRLVFHLGTAQHSATVRVAEGDAPTVALPWGVQVSTLGGQSWDFIVPSSKRRENFEWRARLPGDNGPEIPLVTSVTSAAGRVSSYTLDLSRHPAVSLDATRTIAVADFRKNRLLSVGSLGTGGVLLAVAAWSYHNFSASADSYYGASSPASMASHQADFERFATVSRITIAAGTTFAGAGLAWHFVRVRPRLTRWKEAEAHYSRALIGDYEAQDLLEQ